MKDIQFNASLLIYAGIAMIVVIAWVLYALKSLKAIVSIWYKFVIILAIAAALVYFSAYEVVIGGAIFCIVLVLSALFKLPGISESFAKLIKRKQ